MNTVRSGRAPQAHASIGTIKTFRLVRNALRLEVMNSSPNA